MYFEFDSDDAAADSSGNDSSNNSANRMRCTTTLRNRRYSIHSEIPSRSTSGFGQLSHVSGPNCDLALLAKKKLDEVEESPTLGEIYEPDIKISKAKHSSSDLRREVLLHSMQRSLSMSSEDLSSIGSSPSMRISAGPSRSHSFLSKRTSPLSNRFDNDMEVLREDSLAPNNNYKPVENQVQRKCLTSSSLCPLTYLSIVHLFFRKLENDLHQH